MLRPLLILRSRFPTHDLVIAGSRVAEYVSHLSFSEHDLHRVHFLDFVPPADLAALYNLADACLLPSFYEDFGLNILEAMPSGCPIVLSSTGACLETAGDATLFAHPTSPPDFAAKLGRLLADDSLRTTLREKGIPRAHTFSRKRTAALTLNGLCEGVRRNQNRQGDTRPHDP